MKSRWCLSASLVAILALASCEKRQVQDHSPLDGQEVEYLCVFAVDMSGSYAQFMTENGRAYTFMMRVIDRFFRNRIGANDRVVIAALSANQKALLFDGSPRNLRHEFGSVSKFRDWLLANSNPNGSRIHDGVREALEYTLNFRGVAQGKVKTFVCVLSDMDDNFPDKEASESKLTQKISEYAKVGGIIGLYWVDEKLAPVWNQRLGNSGMKSFIVESEFVREPTIPTFD